MKYRARAIGVCAVSAVKQGVRIGIIVIKSAVPIVGIATISARSSIVKTFTLRCSNGIGSDEYTAVQRFGMWIAPTPTISV